MIRRMSTIAGAPWYLAAYCTRCGSPGWEPVDWTATGPRPRRYGCECHAATATPAPMPDDVTGHATGIRDTPDPAPAPAPPDNTWATPDPDQ